MAAREGRHGGHEGRMTGMGRRSGFVLLIASMVSFGCVRPPPRASMGPPAAARPVGLRPGDAVQVDVWQEPDLTGVFTVDLNGVVVFPLLGVS